jgi:excisionase family DNA binding protein
VRVELLAMAQLTTKEAAQLLKVSDSRVRQLILEGTLQAEKKGRDHLIDEKDLTKFINDRQKPAPKK